MVAVLPLLLLSASQNVYDGQIGKFYKLGPQVRVSGSGEPLEVGRQRLVALKSVKTCLSFATKEVNCVAGEGKMLVVVEATIKNFEKAPMRVGPADSFGLRIYDQKFDASAHRYFGTFGPDLKSVSAQLKTGQSVDVVRVNEFPAKMPHLRIGIWYDTYSKSQTPKFDVTATLPKPVSVFAVSALNFSSKAEVSADRAFDLDGLNFKVVEVAPIENGGYRVRVKIENPMLLPANWGWQYAEAFVKNESGKETRYYPDFTPTLELAGWRNEVPPGGSVVGDYKFFSTEGKPTSFRLTTNNSKRTVTVTGV